MPKFDLILKPGEPIPEEFVAILNTRLPASYRNKLLKHGGLIRVSVSSPYVERTTKSKTLITVDDGFIAALEAEGNEPEALRARLQPLPVKALNGICVALKLPVRSRASSREVREAIVQRLNSGHVWRRIAGEDLQQNPEVNPQA
ncbi:MAG: hypothetical protein ABSE62_08665 [Chthoniobacteraceae bacterium]